MAGMSKRGDPCLDTRYMGSQMRGIINGTFVARVNSSRTLSQLSAPVPRRRAHGQASSTEHIHPLAPSKYVVVACAPFFFLLLFSLCSRLISRLESPKLWNNVNPRHPRVEERGQCHVALFFSSHIARAERVMGIKSSRKEIELPSCGRERIPFMQARLIVYL